MFNRKLLVGVSALVLPLASSALTLVLDGNSHNISGDITVRSSDGALVVNTTPVGSATPTPTGSVAPTATPTTAPSPTATPTSAACAGALPAKVASLPGSSFSTKLDNDDVLSYKFNSGPASSLYSTLSWVNRIGYTDSAKEVSISKCAGAFATVPDSCKNTNLNGRVNFIVGNGSRGCVVEANTTYYVNMHSPECRSGKVCGFIMQKY